MTTTTAVVPMATTPQRVSLIAKLASKYSVEPEKMLETLKRTAFKGPKEVSNEQMMALLVVAHEHGLNPFTRELFAFPDQSGIVPVVSIDGWTRIMLEHPQYDGYEVFWSEETINHSGKPVPTWCEIHMFRKDKSRPCVHREWFDECKRNTAPWGTHPRRMLEHKAIIQTARRCFGFAGIYDQDEAERIVELHQVPTGAGGPGSGMPPVLEKLNAPEPAPAPEEEEQKTEVPPEEHPVMPDIFGDLEDEDPPKV